MGLAQWIQLGVVLLMPQEHATLLFWVFSNNSCYPLPQGCSAASARNACASCNNGYYLSLNQACSLLTIGHSQSDPTGTCTSCFSGYYLLSGVCLSFTQGCSQLFFNGNCGTCYPGFSLQNSILLILVLVLFFHYSS